MAEEAKINKFGLAPKAAGLIKDVFHRHPEISKVVVFGSRAMERFQENSDIDLAIWGDVNLTVVGRIMRELDELPLPYTFDVKAYEMINYTPLKHHIDKFGKILYSAQLS